ncbi:hypothetical protein Mpal_1464 [Methanosphaerula palustris E1-9c]|uniref:Uncharacterized protein n=1 Tax=Methanosphaerula palustris (strain ATCC BAA-1556 / DSM 19958 / E1-9c) TaxID=521011 RepID=B8GI47_METPE|nr:hypothetical protein Mpal_1464 [Methanosphaerula palustris E1-9c]
MLRAGMGKRCRRDCHGFLSIRFFCVYSIASREWQASQSRAPVPQSRYLAGLNRKSKHRPTLQGIRFIDSREMIPGRGGVSARYFRAASRSQTLQICRVPR